MSMLWEGYIVNYEEWELFIAVL